MNNQQHVATEQASVRLDKWLWAARFFKTRSLAKDNIEAGRVTYNGQRAKPGRVVEVGAIIKIPAGYDVKVVKVCAVSDRRQSAAVAQTLYQESAQSLAQREANATARRLSMFHNPKPKQRPDKKQRREIIKLKHQ